MTLKVGIPKKISIKYNAYLLDETDSTITIETSEESMELIQDIRLATGKEPIIVKGDKEEIKRKIGVRYDSKMENNDDRAQKLFKNITEFAIQQNISDIHIEPFEEEFRIRMRRDGKLELYENISMAFYPEVVSFIKLKSGMDIAEKRLPQDGRLEILDKDNSVDVRVSSVPTVNGEKIVMRILNKKIFIENISKPDFTEDEMKLVSEIISKKSGIILVCGPTGSGKTTTVYSIIKKLMDLERNITTIENPIEYKIKGINQIQVNEKVGLTFEKGLRSILRQDPDIIMIGEIRDTETAEIAVRAAITGHLVISTIHTEDAISTIIRLNDMGIKAYLIKASLIGVISQRLVRKKCICCKNIPGIVEKCKLCKGRGYIGRMAIHEIMEINEDIKETIKDNFDKNKIKIVADKSGMISFESSIKKLVENGVLDEREVRNLV